MAQATLLWIFCLGTKATADRDLRDNDHRKPDLSVVDTWSTLALVQCLVCLLLGVFWNAESCVSCGEQANQREDDSAGFCWLLAALELPDARASVRQSGRQEV
jgi:hypothetical protein